MSATFWALNGGNPSDVVVTAITGSGSPWSIAYGGGVYAVCQAISGVPSQTKIFTSSDGVTFNSPTLTDSTAETYFNTCRSGVYANSKFVFAAADASGVIRSVDGNSTGSTFTLRDSGTAHGAYGLCWDGTRFLGVQGTTLAYSTSGQNDAWSESTINGSFSGYGICYGNSLYIAVGASGAIYTSTDRTTWTARTSGTSDILYSVEYSSTLGMYCAVGGTGAIVTSTNGTTWTLQTTPSGVTNLQKVRWSASHSKFVAVGAGKIIYSSDGSTWLTSSYTTTAQFNDIAFNGLEAVATLTNAALAYKSSKGFIF